MCMCMCVWSVKWTVPIHSSEIWHHEFNETVTVADSDLWFNKNYISWLGWLIFLISMITLCNPLSHCFHHCTILDSHIEVPSEHIQIQVKNTFIVYRHLFYWLIWFIVSCINLCKVVLHVLSVCMSVKHLVILKSAIQKHVSFIIIRPVSFSWKNAESVF